MDSIASQITSLIIVYSAVYSGADQRKHQSSASLAFVLGIHRGPVNSPHKWPVTRKMFPFDDVIMLIPVHAAYIVRHLICDPALHKHLQGWRVIISLYSERVTHCVVIGSQQQLLAPSLHGLITLTTILIKHHMNWFGWLWCCVLTAQLMENWEKWGYEILRHMFRCCCQCFSY